MTDADKQSGISSWLQRVRFMVTLKLLVVFVLVGGLIGFVMFQSYFRQHRLESVPAVIRTSRLEPCPDGMFYVDIRFSYTVDRLPFKSDMYRDDFGKLCLKKEEAEAILRHYPLGGQVEASFDPEQPDYAVLDRSMGTFQKGVLTVAGGFAVILSLMFLFRGRRHMPDKISPSQVTTAVILWIGPALLCCSGSHVNAADDWTFSWHTSEVTDLAFTPDGAKLISTSLRDDRISRVVPDERTSQSVGDYVGMLTGTRSHAVAISPDGKQVAIAGFKVTTMYDLKTRNQQWQLDTSAIYKNPPTVKSLAFSPDGKLLATYGSGGRISIRNAETGEEIHRFEGGVHIPAGLVSFCNDCIAFSPDGKLFAAGSFGKGGEGSKPGELRVWDAENGELLHVWKTKDSVQDGKDNAAIHGIAFSPESRRIAIACSDGDVWIWDVATKQVSEKLKGHRSKVRRVAFSPDGRTIASAGLDRTVCVWNAETGKQINAFEIDVPRVNAVTFSPDGKFLVAGGGDFVRKGEIRMWRMHDRTLDPDERR